MRYVSVILPVFLMQLLGACSSDSSCVPHDSQYCDEGVFYWADSCGNLEEVIEQCQCGCLADHTACDPDCSCTPDCAGKECGDDGCEGLCPPGCMTGQHCNQGVCWADRAPASMKHSTDATTDFRLGIAASFIDGECSRS